MRLKNLHILTIAVLFTACQSNQSNANVQNAPNTTTTPAPIVVNNANAVSSNAPTGNVKANQTATSPTPFVSPSPKAVVSPSVSPSVSAAPKYKNYTVNGVVKAINVAESSVTIDHEDIGDYMVAMEMPFPVVNKNVLKNIKVGDAVEFVLETGVGVERIVKIRKK